jgi:hypothetical protein
MKAAAEMVGLVLLGRDMAHRAHWKTRSYSEHIALQGFYEGVLPLVDGFVEQFQGRYNDLLEVPLVDNEFEGEIGDVLEQQMAWIEDHREKICPRSESSLHNVIDEIVGTYQTTLYKLRFLA